MEVLELQNINIENVPPSQQMHQPPPSPSRRSDPSPFRPPSASGITRIPIPTVVNKSISSTSSNPPQSKNVMYRRSLDDRPNMRQQPSSTMTATNNGGSSGVVTLSNPTAVTGMPPPISRVPSTTSLLSSSSLSSGTTNNNSIVSRSSSRGRSILSLSGHNRPTAATSATPTSSSGLSSRKYQPVNRSTNNNNIKQDNIMMENLQPISEGTKDHIQILKSEIHRLKTDEAEWNLEKQKLNDTLKDRTTEFDEKLSSQRDMFLKREDELRDFRSELEDNLRREKADVEAKLIIEKDQHFAEVSELRMQIANTATSFNNVLCEELEKERIQAQSLRQELILQHRSEIEALKEQYEREKQTQLQTLERQFQHEIERKQLESDTERRQLQHEFDQRQQDWQRETGALLDKSKENELSIKESFQETLQQVQLNHSREKQALINESDSSLRQIRSLTQELENIREKYDTQRHETESLRTALTEIQSNSLTQESIERSNQARIKELQYLLEDQKEKFSGMRLKVQAAEDQRDLAKQKLLKEELIRRKLHNQIQELKGNIRVFCRIRPPLPSEISPHNAVDLAKFSFPDQELEGQELLLSGPASESAMGSVTTKIHPFSFDKVFPPSSSNEEVFEEISQLVQSALDGYNVCIFAYGQTGSGKTYTMSADDGMIPRAVNQIFETAECLKEKGWKYEITGEFLEIYNETMNDLLGASDQFDGSSNGSGASGVSKLEIRHDTKLQKTTITDITTVTLDTPSKVYSVLRTASKNRSVAATKANERSSRSHSVFILRITGENITTGSRSEGTLNLIDLAGSERLAHSQATGIRLKETQSINKSLSYLGDVIYALGSGKEKSHIPFRNSKLTYLLQYSLSGNSKTLMFVNISPLEPHVNESLSSLRFATKVNSTQIKKN